LRIRLARGFGDDALARGWRSNRPQMGRVSWARLSGLLSSDEAAVGEQCTPCDGGRERSAGLERRRPPQGRCERARTVTRVRVLAEDRPGGRRPNRPGCQGRTDRRGIERPEVRLRCCVEGQKRRFRRNADRPCAKAQQYAGVALDGECAARRLLGMGSVEINSVHRAPMTSFVRPPAGAPQGPSLSPDGDRSAAAPAATRSYAS